MSAVNINLWLLIALIFIIHSTEISAFWFTAEEPKPTANSRAFYQATQSDYYRPYVPTPFPYLPFQLPLTAAQLAPATVQNVQLVPCLCPAVNQDYGPGGVGGGGGGGSVYDSGDILKRKSHYIQELQQQQQQQQRQK